MLTVEQVLSRETAARSKNHLRKLMIGYAPDSNDSLA
jgi:hypothetical protein